MIVAARHRFLREEVRDFSPVSLFLDWKVQPGYMTGCW